MGFRKSLSLAPFALATTIAITLASARDARAAGIGESTATTPAPQASPANPNASTPEVGTNGAQIPQAPAIPAEGPQDIKPLFRDGFTPAFAIHSGVGHTSGYPNDARAINNPAFYSSSDLMFGTTTSFHLGYALTDYLSFGFMVNLDSYDSSHWRERGEGFGLRVDAFPMLAFPKLAARFQGLGLFLETGIGTVKLEAKVGSYPESNGTQSYAATGAFYEVTLHKWKGSHLAVAPEAKYTHIDSQSISADAVSFGLRLAFYASK